MNATKRILSVLRVTAVAALAVGASVSAASAAEKPIRIGSFLAVTGPASFLGDGALKAIQLQVDTWNANGGLHGHPVEFIHYDSGASAAQARTFATRLLTDDKVDIIIGGSTTGATMATIPLAARHQRPFISVASGIQIVEPVKKWVFKTVASDRMVARRVLEDMENRGLKGIGLLSETSGYGQSGRKETLAVAEELGLKVVADETYAPADTDMTAQLTRIRSNSKVDAVFIFGAGQGPAIATRNYRQLALEQPLYQSPGVASEQFLKMVGDAGNGIRLPAAPLLAGRLLPDDVAVKSAVVSFTEAYEKRWGQPPSAFAGNAHDALLILEAAVKRAGSTEPAALRDAIEATQGLAGINGVFNMGPDDHNGIDYRSLKLWEIQNGGWTLVD